MVSVYKPLVVSREVAYANDAKQEGKENAMPFNPNRIMARRDTLNLKQEDLAKRLGISQQQVSGYEKGHHKPNMEMLVKIAGALDCSTDYLLGLTDVPYTLSGLSDDERVVLERYRTGRELLQQKVVDEGVAKLADPVRDQVKRIIARILETQGKFDNRRNNP